MSVLFVPIIALKQVKAIVRGIDMSKKEKTGISLATSWIIVLHRLRKINVNKTIQFYSQQ
jgi:hypothetical protein